MTKRIRTVTINRLFFQSGTCSPIDLIDYGNAVISFDGKDFRVTDESCTTIDPCTDDRSSNEISFRFDCECWSAYARIDGNSYTTTITGDTRLYLTMNDSATITFVPIKKKSKCASPSIIKRCTENRYTTAITIIVILLILIALYALFYYSVSSSCITTTVTRSKTVRKEPCDGSVRTSSLTTTTVMGPGAGAGPSSEIFIDM